MSVDALHEKQAQRERSRLATGSEIRRHASTCSNGWRVEVGYDNTGGNELPWYAYRGRSRDATSDDELLGWYDSAEEATGEVLFDAHGGPVLTDVGERRMWKRVHALEAKVADLLSSQNV